MSSSLSFVAALLWLVAANLIAMLPSKDHHWSNAYKLIAVGVPILIWLFFSHGWVWMALFMAAAASVLRWPLIYLGRWIRGLQAKHD